MSLKQNMQLLLLVSIGTHRRSLTLLLTHSKRLGRFSSFFKKMFRYFLAMSTVQLSRCRGFGEGVCQLHGRRASRLQLAWPVLLCVCAHVPARVCILRAPSSDTRRHLHPQHKIAALQVADHIWGF